MTNAAYTPSQTVGPFFHDCLLRADSQRKILSRPDTVGEHIKIEGHIYDGDGQGVPDAMIEIWQADHYGRYNNPAVKPKSGGNPSFIGFGRTGTDSEGAYWFETIKPGAVPFIDKRMQAPHINVAIFGRGLLNHLYTRLYFADDGATEDPVLQHVPAGRRRTLMATQLGTVDRAAIYCFDIVLQGTKETVFFNF